MTDPLPMYQINHDREAQRETGGMRYVLRANRDIGSDLELVIWQLPSPATPHLVAKRRFAAGSMSVTA